MKINGVSRGEKGSWKLMGTEAHVALQIVVTAASRSGQIQGERDNSKAAKG